MDTPLYDKLMPTARPLNAVETAALRVCLIHEATRIQQQIDNLCGSSFCAFCEPMKEPRDRAIAALYDIMAMLQPQKDKIDG